MAKTPTKRKAPAKGPPKRKTDPLKAAEARVALLKRQKEGQALIAKGKALLKKPTARKPAAKKG